MEHVLVNCLGKPECDLQTDLREVYFMDIGFMGHKKATPGTFKLLRIIIDRRIGMIVPVPPIILIAHIDIYYMIICIVLETYHTIDLHNSIKNR